MSQRPHRHQRKPSQSLFVSFKDLSAPIPDNVTDNKPAPSNVQAPPSQPICAPTPVASASAETSKNVDKDSKKPTNATT
ncbi:hypothetical protein CRYUN_Cryun05aG0251000 [Craigia yunnanensis]